MSGVTRILSASNRTTSALDGDGNLVSVTDANGHVLQYVFDASPSGKIKRLCPDPPGHRG
jgi:hypothetical protein